MVFMPMAAGEQPSSDVQVDATACKDCYHYGGAKAEALRLYRTGWEEILVKGRWTLAERLFREAVKIDPDFTLGKALVGRISQSPEERRALIDDIGASIDRVDEDGRLILDVFLMTIEAMNARDAGRPLPDGFQDKQAATALANFKAFTDKYPGETGILIEYLEWLHARDGAEAALSAINILQASGKSLSPFLTFFTAFLNAELGYKERASLAATVFERVLNDPLLPQPYYLYAHVYRHDGRFQEAKSMIDRAVGLDPNHLMAKRLQTEIDEILGSNK